MKELRDDQVAALEQLRCAVGAGRRRIMMQAPTGFGKTVLAAALVEGARAKSKKVLFTVPAVALVDQTVEAFWSQGIKDIGVIQAAHHMTDWSQPVQVASVQTLQRRTLPQADVVLVDEAHKWFKFYEKWFFDEAWKNIPIIGLSATPWTRGLGSYYEQLIIAGTTRELIEQGRLSPFRVFAPSSPDLKDVRTVAGDYHEGDLSKAMDRGTLVADIVQTWLKRGENRSTLCFAVDRPHAKHLQQQFEASGVPCGYQDAFTKDDERREIKRKFHNGEIRVVCNVGTLTTGVDWDVRCIIFARPTKSKMLFVQIAGRGLRIAEGKDYCIAEGSLVLTDVGLVPIESVTKQMKVWDGQNWVSHDGVICRGEQEVMEYAGLTATPDHEVWTKDGWKTLAQCACEQDGIAVTERGGEAVRLSENHFAKGAPEPDTQRVSGADGSGRVRDVRQSALDQLLEYCARQIARLPILQSAPAGAEVAGASHEHRKKSMLQSALSAIFGLWRPRNRVPLCFAAGGCNVGADQSWFGQSQASRSYRQQWSLRGWKSAALNRNSEHVAHSEIYPHAPPACVQTCASRGEVCGCNAQAHDERGPHGRGNHRSLAQQVPQAKRRVWDILNAGPLHRFTVSGRLVSNCLFLDHSDNHLRLGFVTDINITRLDNGKMKATAEDGVRIALPKKCPQCAYLKPPRVAQCPACGFATKPTSEVECREGELVELKPATRAPKDKKQLWYSMFLKIGQDRGYKPGWAANQYRQKFGTWPRGLIDLTTEPSMEALNYVRYSMMRYAFRRRDKPASEVAP